MTGELCVRVHVQVRSAREIAEVLNSDEDRLSISYTTSTITQNAELCIDRSGHYGKSKNRNFQCASGATQSGENGCSKRYKDTLLRIGCVFTQAAI